MKSSSHYLILSESLTNGNGPSIEKVHPEFFLTNPEVTLDIGESSLVCHRYGNTEVLGLTLNQEKSLFLSKEGADNVYILSDTKPTFLQEEVTAIQDTTLSHNNLNLAGVVTAFFNHKYGISNV